MEVRLGLSQLKVDTVVGVYPHEREKKRRLIIDVEVVLLNHVKDDELDSTINYEKIAEVCKKVAFEKSYFLIESFAKELLERFFEMFPIGWAEVKVTKPDAIEDSFGAYVKMSRGIE